MYPAKEFFMSRLALYQKYRSQSFDEVIGQDYVVRSVRNAVRQEKVGHAYLFCGPRGTGKTSMARLLARAVNCENPGQAPCGHCANCQASIEGTHPDIIEINAANETHVEDIRDLIDRARLSPMMGRHKIYIIDEVHQLSTSAASALLKTLEEPPEHVIFILATTDPQKLFNTIISRCQRFDFSRVDSKSISAHLLKIAEKEGFALEVPAAEKIAELADGGMRDALSILEQASSYSGDRVTEEAVNEIFGLASTGEKIGLLDDIFDQNLEGILKRIRNSEEHGIDLKRLTTDLCEALKEGVIWQYTGNPSLLHSLNREQAEHIASRAPSMKLLDMTEVLMKASDRYRSTQSTATVFELACMELIAVRAPAEPVPAEKTVNEEKPVNKPVSENISEAMEPVPDIQENMHADEPSETGDIPQVQMPAAVGEMSVDEVLNILVQCSRSCRNEDQEKLNAMLGGTQMNRYIGTLRQADLKASGPDCMLFVCRTQAFVNRISEEEFNEGLYDYLKENGMDKVPFAVSQSLYEEAVGRFRRLMAEKNLPEPVKIRKYRKEEIKEEPKPEDAVFAFFGKENVEVIDEGE